MFGLSDLLNAIADFFYTLVLRLDLALCKIIDILYSMFEVFAGLHKVMKVNGDNEPTHDYLINLFFYDPTINTIYWGMAAIGITLSFGFAMYAIIKKIFDIDDKIKTSVGGILGNLFKGIFSIIILNFMVVAILGASNTLMESVIHLFDYADSINNPQEIVFDDTDYATMARILNTIGNYSLNPSRNSKYNVNACFNEIRPDMYKLMAKGTFNYTYVKYNIVTEGKEELYEIAAPEESICWQYDLTQIAMAHSIMEEQPIDLYDEDLTTAILKCMTDMETYPTFAPLQSYKAPGSKIQDEETPIDVILFLSGTTKAAKNNIFNHNPSIFDTLRYEYVKPKGKDIYNVDQVKKDFDISFAKFDHLTIIIVAIIIAKIFLSLCVNCVARIFNMLLLYIIAPPFIAVTPLDDGEKSKQWWTAFVIQTFSVFGSIIGIRLLMLFVPMIFSSDLVLFGTSAMDFFAKIVMLIAVCITVEQASKLVTGILANNAGMQSLYASEVGNAGAQKILGLGKMATGAALKTASFGAKGLYTVSGLRGKVNKFLANRNNSEKGIGGIGWQKWLGVGAGSFDSRDKSTKEEIKKQKEKEEAAAEQAAKAAAAAGGTNGTNVNNSQSSQGNNTSSAINQTNANQAVMANNTSNQGNNTTSTVNNNDQSSSVAPGQGSGSSLSQGKFTNPEATNANNAFQGGEEKSDTTGTGKRKSIPNIEKK